jgi:hypothetical protein
VLLESLNKNGTGKILCRVVVFISYGTFFPWLGFLEAPEGCVSLVTRPISASIKLSNLRAEIVRPWAILCK